MADDNGTRLGLQDVEEFRALEGKDPNELADMYIFAIVDTLFSRSPNCSERLQESLVELLIDLVSKCNEEICEKIAKKIFLSIFDSVSSSEVVLGFFLSLLNLIAVKTAVSLPLSRWRSLVSRIDHSHVKLVTQAIELTAFIEGDPTETSKNLLLFLNHKSSRVRISVISAVDVLMRKSPWKSTFPIVSLLGAIPSCEIPLDELFSCENRRNYMAQLSVDPHLEVRRKWFATLIGWTGSLEDKEDVDRFFSPYIVLSLVDAGLASEMEESINSKIGPTSLWVKKHARHFIPPLLRSSLPNMLHVIQKICVYLEGHVIEFLPEIMDKLSSIPGESAITCKTIAENCKDAVWWNALRFDGSASKWELLSLLLDSGRELSCAEIRLQILRQLARVRDPSLKRTLQKIWNLVRTKNCTESIISGIVIGLEVVDLSEGNCDLVEITQKIVSMEQMDILHSLVRLLIPLERTDAGIHDSIAKTIERARYINKELLIDLGRICACKVDLVIAKLLPKSNSQEETIVLSVIKTFERNIDPLLIDALMQGDISIEKLVSLCHVHKQLGDNNIKQIIQLVESLRNTNSSLIKLWTVHIFSLLREKIGSSFHPLIDLIIPWALDIEEPASQVVSESDFEWALCDSRNHRPLLKGMIDSLIKFLLSNIHPSESLQIRSFFESKGFIARSAYLSKHMLF